MDNALRVPVIKLTEDLTKTLAQTVPDLLAVEEPLEIRLAYGDRIQNIAVTMRTPGNDADLASGFLFTEGIIAGAADIASVAPMYVACSEDRQNTILVTLKNGVVPNLGKADRNFYTTSSCGVCGKASIESIHTVRVFVPGGPVRAIDPSFILGLPVQLAREQEVFAGTGGLHAAALFDIDGALRLVREDVGRHNAVDKLIGAAMMEGRLPLAESVLLLSGRASFELVQKAAMAGIPMIAAVGAPSSLAVSLAAEFGITLIGFLRDNRFNIYTGSHRVTMPVRENVEHENTYQG